MGKKALVIKKPEALLNILKNHVVGNSNAVFQYVLAQPAFIADRDFCEKDKSLLQYLPYITLVDNSGVEPKVFVYTRGQMGGEGRLLGKVSVGLGGHVEEAPEGDKSIYDILADCAVRELQEEVGLVDHIDAFKGQLGPIASFITPKGVNYSGPTMIYDDSDEVGQYHLGLSFVNFVQESHFEHAEEGVITKGKWMTPLDIIAQSKAGAIELESWSKIVISRLFPELIAISHHAV